MGRIKTKLIKRTAHQLMNLYENKFKDNFKDNKEILSNLADIPSKKIRNVIAGYVTRLIQKQKEEKEIKTN